MPKHHDRASDSLASSSDSTKPAARASGAPFSCSTGDGPGTDPLADVLRRVRLTGALFFRIEASSPWRVEIPRGGDFISIILPRAQHVISYHVVTDGACWGGLIGESPVALEAGDILVIPHGDPYVMMTLPGQQATLGVETALSFFRMMAAGQLPFTVSEGGGGPERMNLVCGFLGCDARPFNPLLATLPRLLHLRPGADAENGLLSRLIELTIAEAREPRAGSESIRLRLSELMFVELMRRHLATLPADQRGWLAGLRDPIIGRALSRLHERPAHPWTLEEIAKEVGLSRSTFAERFTEFVGQPPMQYLAQWRMQVAASLLAEGGMKVSAVAQAVGYESEAAFSRAFAKITGCSPAAWRRAVEKN